MFELVSPCKHTMWCTSCYVEKYSVCTIPDCTSSETESILRQCFAIEKKIRLRQTFESSHQASLTASRLEQLNYTPYPDSLLVSYKESTKKYYSTKNYVDGGVGSSSSSSNSGGDTISGFRRSKLGEDKDALSLMNWNYTGHVGLISTVLKAKLGLEEGVFSEFIGKAAHKVRLYRDLVACASGCTGYCDEVKYVQKVIKSLIEDIWTSLDETRRQRSAPTSASALVTSASALATSAPTSVTATSTGPTMIIEISQRSLSRNIRSYALAGKTDLEIAITNGREISLSYYEIKVPKPYVLACSSAWAEKDQALAECYCLRGFLNNRTDGESLVAVCGLTDLFVNCAVLGIVDNNHNERFFVSERVEKAEDFVLVLLLGLVSLKRSDISGWLDDATERQVEDPDAEDAQAMENKSVGMRLSPEQYADFLSNHSDTSSPTMNRLTQKLKKSFIEDDHGKKTIRSKSTHSGSDGKPDAGNAGMYTSRTLRRSNRLAALANSNSRPTTSSHSAKQGDATKSEGKTKHNMLYKYSYHSGKENQSDNYFKLDPEVLSCHTFKNCDPNWSINRFAANA